MTNAKRLALTQGKATKRERSKDRVDICTANKTDKKESRSPFSSSPFLSTITHPFYSLVRKPVYRQLFRSFNHLWRRSFPLGLIMLPDSAHWASFSSHPQQQFNSLAIDTKDPTKVWIEFLMDHGGFLTLLGFPALCATAAFVGRMRWLPVNCQPHHYGRTAAIYWPTQVSICLNSLVLVVLFASLIWSSESTPMHGLAPAIALTLVAWVRYPVLLVPSIPCVSKILKFVFHCAIFRSRCYHSTD